MSPAWISIAGRTVSRRYGRRNDEACAAVIANPQREAIINKINVFNNREGFLGLFNRAELRIYSHAAGYSVLRERPGSLPGRSVNLRERSVNLQERSVNLRERSVNLRERSVSLRERSVNLRERSVNLRERSVSLQERSVNLRERSVSLRERSVSLRERSVNLQERSVNLRERSVNLRERSVNLRERSVNLRGRYAGGAYPLYRRRRSRQTAPQGAVCQNVEHLKRRLPMKKQ